MQTVTSAHLRDNLASVLDTREPVEITRRGHDPKVLISMDEYKALKKAQFDAEFDFITGRIAGTLKALADR